MLTSDPKPMSTEPDRKRFRLAWWALGPVALLIVMEVMNRPSEIRSDLAVSQAMGGIIGGLLFATLLAWIASALTRHSRTVATIVFSAVITLTVIGQGARRGNESRGVAMAKQAVTEINQELSFAQRAYDSAVKEYVDAGGLDGATLKTRENLDQRMLLLENARDLHKRLIESASTAPDRLDQRLREYHVPEEGTRVVSAEFRQAYAHSKTREALDHEQRVIDASWEGLSLLRDNWGDWRYDAAQSMFEFDSDRLLKRHDAVRTHFERAAKEQEQFLATRPR